MSAEAIKSGQRSFHIKTPLLRSTPLSQILSQQTDSPPSPEDAAAAASAEVWLKMDFLQPSGSFKIRGVGLLCARAAAEGATRFVASSGGNAGMAVAHAGRILGIRTTIVIPTSTAEFMADRLRAEGAEVRVHGENWNAADVLARKIVAETQHPEKAVYVHPFDDSVLWEGHASLMEEIKEDWEFDTPPDAVICVVGGGGLLLGVAQGLDTVGWSDVPIIAAETQGAHALDASVKANAHTTLPEITSIATSLGARKVATPAYELLSSRKISTVVVSDAQAVRAALRFADDHRSLVEPACAAGLAVVYEQLPVVEDCRRVVVIVCGGNQVTLAALRGWQERFRVESAGF